MKTTITTWAMCVFLLVGSGIWIGLRSNDEQAIRRRVFQELAQCTIQDAHAEKCWLPCASDEDCMAKNGMRDH